MLLKFKNLFLLTFFCQVVFIGISKPSYAETGEKFIGVSKSLQSGLPFYGFITVKNGETRKRLVYYTCDVLIDEIQRGVSDPLHDDLCLWLGQEELGVISMTYNIGDKCTMQPDSNFECKQRTYLLEKADLSEYENLEDISLFVNPFVENN